MDYQELLARELGGNTVQTYLIFAGIILGGWIFKKLISTLIGRLVYWIFKKSAGDLESTKFIETVLLPLELLVVLLAVFLGVHQLDYPLEEVLFVFKEKEITFKMAFDRLFEGLMVFCLTWMVIKIVEVIAMIFTLRAEKTESQADDQIVHFVREMVKLVVYAAGILLFIGVAFGVNIAGLLAGLGIGGIAIALAATESLENLIAGFTIFLDKPFVVGDLVKVVGYTGNIEKVGFRSTRIRTLEKSYITLPNKKMVDQALDNLSLRTARRVSFHLGVTYDTSVSQIQSIVEDIKKVIDEEELTISERNVNFESFGDSALNILIIYFINTPEWDEYLEVRQKINFRIMQIVEEHGSSIAFPTRTLHLFNETKNLEATEDS